MIEGVHVETQTPSEAVINKNNAAYKIYDSLGREIVIKKPYFLAQFKLIAMLGDFISKNEVYMKMVMPALYVDSIDGIPSVITTKNELDAVISRIGEDSYTSVIEAIREKFQPEEEGGKEEIKKS